MTNMTQCTVFDYLLESGAAILTGGVDLLENPILIIRPGRVQQCELVTLLLHYLKTMSLSLTSPPTVTCVADLQATGKNDIIDFVEALEAVETPVRGRITALYLLKPKVKDRSQLLKKLLGLKTSKTYHKSQIFKVFLVKSRRELHKYIEISELPEELGGLLHYDHQAWLYFYKTVTPCIQAVSELVTSLPEIRDRVDLLQEYDLSGRSSTDLTSLRQELLHKYQTLIREARLTDIVDQCKQTMHFLESPDDPSLSLVHRRLVKEAAHCLRTSFVQIKEYQTEIETLWDRANDRLVTAQRIEKCKELANEMEETIAIKYRPQLKEHPAIGKTLSQAELYRAHFTAAIYEPSKDLLNTATETLEVLSKLSADSPEVVASIADVTQQLSRAVHPFTDQLQEIQTTYIAVHVFHILLSKSVHWYKKVLKFLPESLRHHVTQRAHNKLIATPREWKLTVKTFLDKHPSPREEHLIRMDSDIPHQIHRSLKQQAHTVALRIRFLNRLLRSKCLPVKLILAAFKWKDEITSRQGSQFSRYHTSKSGHRLRRNSQKRKATKRQTSSTAGDIGAVDGQHNSSLGTNRKYRDSSSWNTADDDKLDLENLSERYQKNWEDLASARQLERFTNGQNNPVTQSVTSYSANQNEGNELETVYACSSRSLHSAQDERSHNFPSPRSPLSPTERFVNLTLTANNNNREETRRVFSLDGSSLYDAGSESGIEVAEREDPCDSLMKKIRAVSTSRLPSDLKLKYVSELISCSLTSSRHHVTNTADSSMSDHEGYRRPYLSKNSGNHNNTLNNLGQVSTMRQNLAHSMDNLNHSDADVMSLPPMRGSSLRDVSTFSNERRPSRQFDKSLMCSFRPEDISLVLEDVSGDVTNLGSQYKSLNSLGSLTDRSGYSGRRSLSLDDLLDESFSLSQASWAAADLDAASSVMDIIDWSAVEDRDSVSSLSLQADLSRLKQCQEHRLAEVAELSEEQGRYNDIELTAESVNQDDVEMSLMRSETILQEEEATLHERMHRMSLSNSETHVLPMRLKKSDSRDQGYDSPSSMRTGASECAAFDGPDFY
ncbi:uncharacterized protein LOC121381188 [Gigantopelta aegis]|uniref:uncharacterized protein LOC121381188 n=1 Tax=Gigantopelta aegis TaxID=1735272 RepID=UPI001B8884BD|nr:uncharacterized protein LOC121381188 [Gigantopelta aegis]